MSKARLPWSHVWLGGSLAVRASRAIEVNAVTIPERQKGALSGLTPGSNSLAKVDSQKCVASSWIYLASCSSPLPWGYWQRQRSTRAGMYELNRNTALRLSRSSGAG